jgi:hypothetical protein
MTMLWATAGSTITATTIAKVQASITAALGGAHDSCNQIKSHGGNSVSYSDSISIASELSNCYQVVASALSKVTDKKLALQFSAALGPIE